MKIAISGVSGLIGSHLSEKLHKDLGAKIYPISRDLLYGDTDKLSNFIDGCEIIIHLSGAPVFSRWTTKKKRIIWDSRVKTTSNLNQAICKLKIKPDLFISTSAVGIYDESIVHTEYSKSYSTEFIGKLCQEWEKAASLAVTNQVRTVIFRLGVVLSDEGGALTSMIPIFKWGLGGRLGNGNQPFPFIHLTDLLNAYIHVIKSDKSTGIYNLVAPEIVTNKYFTRELALLLNRPLLFPVPSIFLKLIFGKRAKIILTGQKVLPNQLLSEGFCFKYLTLNSVLSSFK